MVALFLFPLISWANDSYIFEELSCSSLSEALKLAPQVFSTFGIQASTLEEQNIQANALSYVVSDHDAYLSLTFISIPGEGEISALFPDHVQIQTDTGWFLLSSKQVLFAQQENNTLSLFTSTPLPKTLSIPQHGCTIETNRKFSPYLPNSEKKQLYLDSRSTIIDLELPLLPMQKEPHFLFSKAKYLSKAKPLGISLRYAPLIVQLNFSPMFWLYHSAFPLQDEEHMQLLAADPFDSGTLIVFDMQHGAPEPYPSLIAIPIKGCGKKRKERVDEKLRNLFAIAKFDYRKGEFGYRWREWEIVPVQRGIIISKSPEMLKEALDSLEDQNAWPQFSDLQKDFLQSELIGMHFNLNDAQSRKKVREQNLLPNELSLTLSPTEEGWKIKARSDLKGAQSLPYMIAQNWYQPQMYTPPPSPIEKDMLLIAGNILASGIRPSSYLSNSDLLQKGWITPKEGLYSVHPTSSSIEIHYCSQPKSKEALHLTWAQGVIYQNPKPCDR